MKLPEKKLLTPIHLKLDADPAWPEDEKVFYLLTADGLFLCRNHLFFKSSVAVDGWPTELAKHKAFIKMRYPKVPQRLLERIVGFFSIIGRRYAAEAAVLLAWDRNAKSIVPIIPAQCATVGENWHGEPFPIDVQYVIPDLPPHLMLIGDIHSHVDGGAYASATDRDDEMYRAGLHIVVGRLFRDEPPDFHIEVTVDSVRFKVNDPNLVFLGYRHRREHEVPPEWIEKVTVKSWSSARSSDRESEERPREHPDYCRVFVESRESESSRAGQPCPGDTGSPGSEGTKQVPSPNQNPP